MSKLQQKSQLKCKEIKVKYVLWNYVENCNYSTNLRTYKKCIFFIVRRLSQESRRSWKCPTAIIMNHTVFVVFQTIFFFCIAGFGPFEHFESLNGHLCHSVPVGVTLTLLFFNCKSSEMWEINKLVRDATIWTLKTLNECVSHPLC